jgi:hypothetical protein
VPAIDQSSNILMIDEFASVGGGKPFVHFLDEPFIVVDHVLEGFHRQRFTIAALLEGG